MSVSGRSTSSFAEYSSCTNRMTIVLEHTVYTGKTRRMRRKKVEMVKEEDKEEENIVGSSKRKRAVAHFSVRGKLDYFPGEFGISFWI